MPRTVEHIVACHTAASALRRAGKPVWSRRINIRSIIQEDPTNESPEHISANSLRIAALIRAKLPVRYFDVTDEVFDFDFVDAVECMENCTPDVLAEDKKNGVEAVEMFNSWLEVIYDWADNNRIWLGV